MCATPTYHAEAVATFRHRYEGTYRRGGFAALLPRARADQGSARAIPQPVVDLLCQLKEDNAWLSIPALIKIARERHTDVVNDEVVLAESTVHR